MTTGTIESKINFDQAHVWHPFTSLSEATAPVYVTEAKGVYLHTSDGRSIIDGVSSWWVNLHGHSNPVIAHAIFDQAMKLEHVIFAGFTHEPAITLTQNLLTVLPSNQHRIFFSDNGSTAVEVAIKMALQYFYNTGRKRKRIIALNGSYHGDTFGSMSVGERGTFTKPFQDYLFDVSFIGVPNEHNFEGVLEEFKRHVDEGDVAAFIYEPLVQGAAGMIMYEAHLFESLLAYASHNDVICIADEVFTGFGRTGKWFASEYMDTKPDIIAVSKGITGGTLPLGVTACSKKIASAFESNNPAHTFFHGHSYTANPIACAAANASFSILKETNTWKNIRRIEESHSTFVKKVAHHKHVRNVRSIGTILALELEIGDTDYFNDIRKNIYSFFVKREILLRPLGNIIYVLPPYVIEEPELKRIYDAIEDFLQELG